MQPTEALLQSAVRLLPRVQQPECEHGRQGQQHAAPAHRLGRDELRGGFRQLPQPGQGALGASPHRHAPRGARRVLAPGPRPPHGEPRGAPEFAAAHRMANRAFGHPDLRRRVPDRLSGLEQLRHPLALRGGEPMRAAGPALAIDHSQHPVRLELALLPIERGAVDAQCRAEFVLPGQAQRHHLPGGHAASDHVIGPMHEQRHPRGEVRDLFRPLDDRHDGVDLPCPRGLGRQVQLRPHERPSR